MLAEVFFGFRGPFWVLDELALQFPAAVFAAGALDRTLEFAQLALLGIDRHDFLQLPDANSTRPDFVSVG